MKRRIVLISFLFLAVLLNGCSGAAATSSQSPTTASTAAPAGPAATTAPAATPTYEMITVKMNSSTLTSYAPIFIADAEGYFAEYGIKIDYVTLNKSNQAIPLLASGDLDVYAGAVNAGLLNVLGQENDVKVVADRGHFAPGDDCTYQAIMVRKDLYDSGAITKPADLKGQVVATTNAGTAGYLVSTYLAQAGLTFNDIQISDIPTSNYVEAFNNKSVAAIATTELFITQLLSAGNAVVLAKGQDVLGTTQSSVLAFGKNLLVDHPDVGVRFMAAYLKGVQQYNLGKTDRNLQIVSDATQVSIPDLKTSCWVKISSSGAIDFAGVDKFQQWSIAQGQLDKPVTEEQFWDPSVIAAAQKLLDQ